MKNRNFVKRILVLCTVFMSSLLFASSDVELVGTWTVTINTSTVRVEGYRIQNYSDNGQTGTLQLKLMLTKTKYDGGTISGRTIFTQRYEPLAAGEYYYDIDETHSLESPIPAGSYYRTLILLNYIDDEYQITDYINFDGLVTFEDEDPEADVHFSGSWQVSFVESDVSSDDDRIHVTGGDIKNKGTGSSDDLKLVVCFSKEPYSDNGDYYKVAHYYYDPLKGGYQYSDVDLSLEMDTHPPSGSYYVTLTLWEWNGDSYEEIRYFELDGRIDI